LGQDAAENRALLAKRFAHLNFYQLRENIFNNVRQIRRLAQYALRDFVLQAHATVFGVFLLNFRQITFLLVRS